MTASFSFGRLAEDECTERLRTKKFSAAFDAGKQTEVGMRESDEGE